MSSPPLLPTGIVCGNVSHRSGSARKTPANNWCRFISIHSSGYLDGWSIWGLSAVFIKLIIKLRRGSLGYWSNSPGHNFPNEEGLMIQRNGHLKSEKLWRFMRGLRWPTFPFTGIQNSLPWKHGGMAQVAPGFAVFIFTVTRRSPRTWAGYRNITTYFGLCIKGANVFKCSIYLFSHGVDFQPN